MTAVARYLADPDATDALGARLGQRLRAGDVVALHGPLGAGKSALARAMVRAAAGDPELEVPSPTFTLVQHYQCRGLFVAHFDLYRIGDPDEVLELDWDDARADGAVLVEWPERLGPLLPEDRLDIALSAGPNGSGRTARLTAYGRWIDRLTALDDGETL